MTPRDTPAGAPGRPADAEPHRRAEPRRPEAAAPRRAAGGEAQRPDAAAPPRPASPERIPAEPLGALPPAGEHRSLLALLRALSEPDPTAAAARALRARLGVATVQMHGSGREALRCALAAAAERSGRTEVVIPAYTCYSVPAAAVAAGLRVRLVEVDPHGRIDPADLERLPLERAAAVVVCNLFGLPEPLGPLRERAQAAGAVLLDDAAQSFGAADAEGSVGARGEPAVLSFGRGKPLSALGGGALCWPGDAAPDGAASAAQPTGRRTGVQALAHAAVHELALSRWIFPVLAALPQLHVGETPFDPGFSRDPLGAAGGALLLAALEHTDAAAARRRAHAHALAAQIQTCGAWRPLLDAPQRSGVFPRLALLAPSAALRERALARLAALGAGASTLYPQALCDLLPLAPHRAGPDRPLPVARDLAARLLTLPTHGRLRGARLQLTLAALAQH